MKMPKVFPEVLSVGNAEIKIYRTTQKSQKLEKAYTSFLVSYYEGAKRILCRHRSYEEARKKAKEIEEGIRESDYDSIRLSGLDRRIYQNAIEKLAPIQVSLDQAVADFSESYDKLKPYGLSIRQAVDVLTGLLSRLETASLEEVMLFYERHGQQKVKRKCVTEVTTELLESLEKDNCGKYHLRDLETRLGRFGMAFNGYIDEIRQNQIVDWLQDLTIIRGAKSELNKRLSPKTRNNYLNALSELFNFSKSRGYLPKLLPTEIEGVKHVKESKSQNHIIAPNDLSILLKAAPADLLPSLAIKAFSGVRSEEMSKLTWEAIKFDQKSVIIDASISKLGQRRVIPLASNLALWLEPYKELKGIICKQWLDVDQLTKAWKKFAAEHGVSLKKNSFRNSYISYRLALPTPSAIVAQECGNSPRMIESEYKELATNDQGVAWFDIGPSGDYAEKVRQDLRKETAKD